MMKVPKRPVVVVLVAGVSEQRVKERRKEGDRRVVGYGDSAQLKNLEILLNCFGKDNSLLL